MAKPGLLARILAPIRRAVEGAVRPGPYYLPITGGWLPDGAAVNWWQMGMTPAPFPRSAIVEACVSAYAQTIAMCPGDHWRSNPDGGRERVKNSALTRFLRRPNSYQTISDFMLNAVRDLYSEGNAYALALRNDRFEIDELHLMRAHLCQPQLAETGEVFYQLAGNDVIARALQGQYLIVPQRDVLHIRLHSDRRFPHPLIGESPLIAATLDMATSGAISEQQLNFYLNQARPSAVLSTDLQLDRAQVEDLRQRWDEMSKGLNQGKTPILTSGLKVLPWSVGGRDSQIADMMKISDQHVALVYRVPLQILGLGDSRYNTTEALMNAWVASGLGFALNHIEEAFGLLFGLRGQPDEYLEFDTAALLRSAFKDRIDALKNGVQGGIYSPNEARTLEGLAPVDYGDEPRVQQQVVPLSAAGQIAAPAPFQPKPPGAPGPPAAPAASAAPSLPPPPKMMNADDIKRERRRVRDLVAEHNRRLR